MALTSLLFFKGRVLLLCVATPQK